MTDIKEEQFEDVESKEDGLIRKAESDENIFKTTEKISALDIAWNFDDPISDAALTEYKKRGLRYKDLSSLEDKDLELMGITEESIRSKMLHDFRHLPNQEAGYEETLKKVDIPEYTSMILENIGDHIDNLRVALVAAQVKIGMNSLEDVVIMDEKVHGSELVMKTIGKMMYESHEIGSLLDDKVGEYFPEDQSNGMWKNIMKAMAWIGGIGLITYAGQKFLRAKRILT